MFHPRYPPACPAHKLTSPIEKNGNIVLENKDTPQRGNGCGEKNGFGTKSPTDSSTRKGPLPENSAFAYKTAWHKTAWRRLHGANSSWLNGITPQTTPQASNAPSVWLRPERRSHVNQRENVCRPFHATGNNSGNQTVSSCHKERVRVKNASAGKSQQHVRQVGSRGTSGQTTKYASRQVQQRQYRKFIIQKEASETGIQATGPSSTILRGLRPCSICTGLSEIQKLEMQQPYAVAACGLPALNKVSAAEQRGPDGLVTHASNAHPPPCIAI